MGIGTDALYEPNPENDLQMKMDRRQNPRLNDSGIHTTNSDNLAPGDRPDVS